MSTRSAIIVKAKTGQYEGIYCHFDGYIEGGVGDTLKANFNDLDKAQALMDLGDCSVVAGCVRVTPIGPHRYGQAEGGTVVAYGRDRGEQGCEKKVGKTVSSVAKRIGHDGYIYVFADGAWTCNGKKY